MRDPVDAPVPSVQEPSSSPNTGIQPPVDPRRTIPHPSEALKAEVLFRYLIDQVQAGSEVFVPPHVTWIQAERLVSRRIAEALVLQHMAAPRRYEHRISSPSQDKRRISGVPDSPRRDEEKDAYLPFRP